GHAVLGEVVGADLLAAVAGAHLAQTRIAQFFLPLAQFLVVEPGPQHRHRLIAVLELRFLVLVGDDQAGWYVGDPHGAVGGVDALAAVPGGPEDVNAQVGGVDLDLDLSGFGHHGHRRGGGVDTPTRLGSRHALHTVDAAFVFQEAIGAPAPDLEDHFFQPA